MSTRVNLARIAPESHESQGTAALSGVGVYAPRKPGPHSRQAANGGLPWYVTLFMISLVIPWIISLGPVRMSPYRFVLLATLVPCLVMWLSGQAGRIRLTDIVLLLYCFWCTLSFVVVHGIGTGFQSGIILLIETMGPYLLARCWIRDEDSFYQMTLILFFIVATLLPFGIIELYTGYKPLLSIFGLFFPSIDITEMDVRWGLRRVQGPLEHPILFGVFCGGAFALTHLVLGYEKPLFQRWAKSGLVAATTLLCLSSGPTSALVAQILLLTWNGLLKSLKARWKILWGLLGAMYVFISLTSTQSVPAFYITHAPLFDRWSAYYRLLIWEYGSATALRHPFFGIGFNDYERPYWMVASVDMFWLVHAIVHGIPAAVMMMFALGWTALVVGLKKGLNARAETYRTAFLIAMVAFFLSGWTVHYWNATYVLFLFLLGSGVWFLDAPAEAKSAGQAIARNGSTFSSPTVRRMPPHKDRTFK